MKHFLIAILALLLVACGTSTTQTTVVEEVGFCKVANDCACPQDYESSCADSQCLCSKTETVEVEVPIGCQENSDCNCGMDPAAPYEPICQDSGLCYCKELNAECYELNRALFVDQLVRKLIDLDSYVPPIGPTFADVPVNHMFFKAIEAAEDLGIISPNQPDGNFRPNDSLNRAEGSKMVIQAINGLENYTPPPMPNFEDVPEEAWFFGYVEAAFQLGLTKGYVTFDGLPSGFFGPGNIASSCFMNEMMAHALI